MKRTVSMLLVVSVLLSMVAVLSMIPAGAYSYSTPYVKSLTIGRNGNGCQDKIDVKFRSVSGVNNYRLMARLTYQSGSPITSLKTMKEVNDGGHWDVSTTLYLDNSWLSEISTLGCYDVINNYSQAYDVPSVRLYVTVVGINNSGQQVTGYTLSKWVDIWEDDLCPIVIGTTKGTSGGTTSIYVNTKMPLATSAIKYYRIYGKKGNSWYRLGDVYWNDARHGEDSAGRCMICPIKTSELKKCNVNGDGTMTLTVRGLNGNKQFCTPFMKQYWWKSELI